MTATGRDGGDGDRYRRRRDDGQEDEHGEKRDERSRFHG
jgi:hypothetical protein